MQHLDQQTLGFDLGQMESALLGAFEAQDPSGSQFVSEVRMRMCMCSVTSPLALTLPLPLPPSQDMVLQVIPNPNPNPNPTPVGRIWSCRCSPAQTCQCSSGRSRPMR